MKLTVTGLTKTIDNTNVLNDVSFTLEQGQILGVVGRNGIGKTTLFRTITGVYLADGGDVLIDDKSINTELTLRQNIFFVDPFNNFFNSYNAQQVANMYHLTYDRFDKAQFLADLAAHNLPTNQRYRRFSKGMQALFNVLLAINSHAQFIILDEPFDGLDIIVLENVKRILIEAVQQRETSLMISSHNLAELDTLIDKAIILKENTVVQEYKLENAREDARKLQLVFPDDYPEELKQYGTIVEQRGRVYVVVFDQYTRDIDKLIAEQGPILFEELPLGLEDLFRTKLVDEVDYIMNK